MGGVTPSHAILILTWGGVTPMLVNDLSQGMDVLGLPLLYIKISAILHRVTFYYFLACHSCSGFAWQLEVRVWRSGQ